MINRNTDQFVVSIFKMKINISGYHGFNRNSEHVSH